MTAQLSIFLNGELNDSNKTKPTIYYFRTFKKSSKTPLKT
jgi:hypothetical protein